MKKTKKFKKIKKGKIAQKSEKKKGGKAAKIKKIKKQKPKKRETKKPRVFLKARRHTLKKGPKKAGGIVKRFASSLRSEQVPKPKLENREEQVFGDVYRAKITLIGVGGGGGSIINELAPKLRRVGFVAANTDIQALRSVAPRVKHFQFGQSLTHGLGCGMNPNLGRLAAQTEKERIAKLFEDSDLCILVSCFGGGTGSGAAPVFAEVLRELKKITFGVFTMPFKFEGDKKLQIARDSLEKTALNLNAFTIFPNEKIFQVIDKKTPLKEAFSAINKSLAQGLEGLIEMVYLPGLINIDFTDLKMILDGQGKIACLNSAESSSPERAQEVAKKVLQNPLNEYNIEIDGLSASSLRLVPEKILFNISAASDLKMKEVEQISRAISNYNKQAKIIFGVSYNKNYGDKLRVVLLATGSSAFEKKPKKGVKKKPTLKPSASLFRRPKKEETSANLTSASLKKEESKKETRPAKAKSVKLKSSPFIVKKKKETINSFNPVEEAASGEDKKSFAKFGSQKKTSKKIVPGPEKSEESEKTKKDKGSGDKTNLEKKEISPSNPSDNSSLEGDKDKTENSLSTAAKEGRDSAQNRLIPAAAEKPRKNALDLKKETEQIEKEMRAQEEKWDIPAFLRRREEGKSSA